MCRFQTIVGIQIKARSASRSPSEEIDLPWTSKSIISRAPAKNVIIPHCCLLTLHTQMCETQSLVILLKLQLQYCDMKKKKNSKVCIRNVTLPSFLPFFLFTIIFVFNHRYCTLLPFFCFSDMCKYIVTCGVPILKANTNLYAFSIWQCLFYTMAGCAYHTIL